MKTAEVQPIIDALNADKMTTATLLKDMSDEEWKKDYNCPKGLMRSAKAILAGGGGSSEEQKSPGMQGGT